MSRVFAIVLLTALPLFASQAPPPDTCPPRVADTTFWITVTDEPREYQLRLPSSLPRAPADKYKFIHGGEVWEDARTKVSIAYGHWDEISFGEMKGKRCRIAIGDANVFVIVSADKVLAWYDRRSGLHEPVVTASSDELDGRKLAAIALSLTRVERATK